MIELFILDVEEWRPVIDVAERAGRVTADRADPYVRLSSAEPIVIDRRATGVRHSVWYSTVGALRGGQVTQFDKDALRIDPA